MIKTPGPRGTPDHFFQCLRKQKTDGFIEGNESLKQIELITHVSFFAPTWVGYQRDPTLTGRSNIIGKTGSEDCFP